MNSEFKVIYDDLNNKIFNMFKVVIDKSVIEGKELELNDFDLYIYIWDKCEDLVGEMAEVCNDTSGSFIDPKRIPITEEAMERIDTYMSPYAEKAYEYFNLVGEYVLNASSYGDLCERKTLIDKMYMDARNRGIDGMFDDCGFDSLEYVNLDKKEYKKRRNGLSIVK